MDLGILFLGVLAQIIGAFIAKDKMMYAGSLWLGVLLALAATYHMYRSLDRALDQPEKTAQKMIFRGYILRYVILIFILLVLMKTEVMNPLIFFFSYVICMKVTAFLQPLTHKLCNKMFHETDPIPQASSIVTRVSRFVNEFHILKATFKFCTRLSTFVMTFPFFSLLL